MVTVIGYLLITAGIIILARKASAEMAGPAGKAPLEPIPIQVPAPGSIDALISAAAHKYSVNAALIKAVAMTESSLNPNATNPKDPSYGLMGIMPILAEDFGIVRDWHNVTAAELAMIKNPETNLNIGAWFLSKLLGKYSFDQAIQSYNVGEQGYKDGSRNSGYLANVTRYYNEFRNNTIG